MSASKTLKEATAILAPLGFEPVGLNENSHTIFRHRATGVVYGVSTNRLVEKSAIIATAQRRVRHAQSTSHRFVNWLLNECEVGDYEERQVSISVSQMGAKFLREYPDIRGVSHGLWLIALKQNPQATLVTPGARGVVGSQSVWKLRGPLFGITAIDGDALSEPDAGETIYAGHPKVDPAFAEKEESDGQVADRNADRVGSGELPVEPVVSPGVEEGAASEPPVTEADDEGARDAARRAAADTDLLPVEELMGVVIPPKLAAQLTEVFGDGDTKAENELLRAAVTEAAGLLERAAGVLLAAATLNGTDVRKASAHPKAGIGPKNLKRLRLLGAHREEFPTPMTADDVEEFFHRNGEASFTHSTAGSLLWILAENGILRRTSAGVYEWAE